MGVDATSCHRVIYPLQALPAEDYSSEALKIYRLDEQLESSDIVLFQCLAGATEKNLPIISHIQKQGKKVIIDYDDDFSSLPDVKLKQIGKSQDDITVEWKAYLQAADLITVTTSTLANRVKSFTDKPVKILPNLIRKADFDCARDYDPFEDTSEIRILYSCSSSHALDFKYIALILKWLGERYSNVKIISQGSFGFTYFCPKYRGRTKHYPKIPYSSYYQSLLEIQPHIFIAPLRVNQYNICRSDLKYLQSATIKAAFIGNNLPPYHGIKKKTAILTDTRFGWLWNLRKLIKNLDKARSMGRAARRNIREHFILEDHIRLWSNTYDELLCS